MSLFSRREQKTIDSKVSIKPPLELKDERSAVCPYCGVVLRKVPGAATKCPGCKETMYVRTDQVHRIRRIVTRDEANELDDQNEAFALGELEEFIRRREDTRSRLRKKFGLEPKYGDIRWSLFNGELMHHASQRNMGLYRNTLYKMMDHLYSEGNESQGLTFRLMVFYIDMNEPNNLGGYTGPEVKQWGPLPKLERGSLLEWLGGDTIEFGKSITEIAQDFEQRAEQLKASLKMPRDWTTVWQKCL